MAPRFAPLALVPLLLLAGCAASPAPASAPVERRRASPSRTATPASPSTPRPERVVAIKSTSVEMMLALGVGDRIVGTAFTDGPVPEEWADEAAGLTSISDFMPNEESVLELEPDLVYSGWESAFSADAAGTRDELASLGIASYIAAGRLPQHHAPEADLRRGVRRDP